MTNNIDYNQPSFFIKDKILINNKLNTPFLVFKNLENDIKLKINNIYLDNKIQIFDCAIDLKNNKFNNFHNFETHSVKKILIDNDKDNQYKILRAYQLINWHRRSKFCGTCGNILEFKNNKTEKFCKTCEISIFPRFSPAIMVLIKKNQQILLARSHHFPKGIYSALAGFIDMGETAEEAVYREVKEEVGISIKNIKYFGTQAWPFPDSFMIAFTADYHSGEIVIDKNEIEDAQWFDLNNLPELSSHISISRHLIDSCFINN